jgi:2-oxoglutarate ferredoxin oxidoreductase subunit gamma
VQEEVAIAGFGGQGVLFLGQLLAQAAMLEDKEVTWIPSYGPEMRGGTANCTVIVSDEPIGSPVVQNPASAIVMNVPSMVKYEPTVKPGGLLVINSSLIHSLPKRKDIRALLIPANAMAAELGNAKLANVIVLGAYRISTGVVVRNSVMQALSQMLSGKPRELLNANLKALAAGEQAALQQLQYHGGEE